MKNRHPYKYLILLASAYFCTFPIIGITFQKPISIFSFQMPSSVLVYPLTFVILDIIVEIYGYAIARQIIWCHIILSIYYNFVLFGILSLPSPATWAMSNAFQQIFNSGVKLTAFFGQLGILVGFLTNAYLLSKLKILTKGRYFWMRSVGSSCIGEFIQLSMGLIGAALGGLWKLEYIIQLLLVAFIFRLLFISIFSLPAVYIAELLKRSEDIDTFDDNVDFNPFLFKAR